MGKTPSHEALALRRAELCNDPLLRGLPGKFLAAGAVEVRIVDQDGTPHGFGANGPQACSRFGVSLPTP